MTATATRQTVPRLCTTGTVVCLATGPSLTADDVNYVRGKATVIAVNNAWKLAPWADCLYSSDQAWFPFHKWVPEFTGLKITMNVVSDPQGAEANGVLMLRYSGDHGVEWNPTALKSAKNSGGAAINLAVHLGATRVLLLGYDMKGSHFFGRHPHGLRNNEDKQFRLFQRHIDTMVEPLKAHGIEVVNCSRDTALTSFPRHALRDVL